MSSFGPLNHQPLLFNSNGQMPIGSYYYTQIGLSMSGVNFQTLDLAFDFTDTGSKHDFIVLFDAPQVRNFHFTRSQISFENPTQPTVNVGTYLLGQAYHFDMHLDYLNNQWSFFENGSSLASGLFNPSGSMQSIRFNYSADGLSEAQVP